jgi:stage II sporulation protein D
VIFLKKMFAVFSGFLAIIICFNFVTLFGASRNVKIGLERHYIGVGSIPVSDGTLTVQIGDGGKYTVSSGDGFTIQAIDGGFYDSGLKFSTYSEAKQYASAFSGDAIPAVKDSGWRVYFSKTVVAESTTETTTAQIDTDVSATIDSTSEDATGTASSSTSADSVNSSVNTSASDVTGFASITLSSNALAFKASGSTAFIYDSSSSAYISTGSGIVNLGGFKYRDTIEVYRNGSTVNAVNILPLEQYLKGVVTSEMPQSWPIEAIKAQTVAARTYTQRNLGKHGRYDLCDSTDCQQYNGVNGESSAAAEAVSATSGVMAYYNGALISATYFSSSGGHTQNAEDVWGTAVPYLVGVKELNETGGKQWVRTFAFTEITDMCKKAGLSVGNVTAVRVGEALDGGLVKTMIIDGTEGSATLEREDIRNLFKNSTDGALYSRNFRLSSTSSKANNVYVMAEDGGNTVDISVVSAVAANGIVGPIQNVNTVVIGSTGEYVLSSDSSNMTEAQDSITITGSGYGHGVGMSQYGAKGMAELGYDYKSILKYYYTGIDVY